MLELLDYIKVFPNVLDKRVCEDILNNKEYKYMSTQIMGPEGQYLPDTTVRNCKGTRLFEEDDNIIYQAVGTTLDKYIEELQPMHPTRILPAELEDSGYDLLKYEKGGFYLKHTDESKIYTRRASISFLLNEEYEGGELQFFGDYKVQGETGSAIIFPSNFCYPHEVLPIKSGTRYSIITWVF
jgi:predicted 2-oxoglutarate/Fe(II)-dependent dioxygenase YbiX